MKYRLLCVFYKELYPMMNKEDKKNQNEMCEDVKLKYNQYLEALQQKKKTIPAEVLECFDAWEIELREIMHSKGLLMPKRDDPNYALGGTHY